MSNHPRKITSEEISLFEDKLRRLQTKAKTKGITKLRCAIYARKSSKDETETSLPAQISYCRKLIDSCEYLEETHLFQEDNVSGMFVDNRVEFMKMFELVGKHEIDVIVCMKWDRFARRTSDSQSFNELARIHQVYVLAGDNAIYVKDSASNFTQTVYQATAELYARRSAEDTFNTLATAAEEGRYVCGKPPLGYRKNSIGKLEINLDEAIIVNKIFNLIKERKNVNIICQ